MKKKTKKLSAAEMDEYKAGLKGKTPKQLVALYRATKDEDKMHAIFRELLSRSEIVNVVEAIGKIE